MNSSTSSAISSRSLQYIIFIFLILGTCFAYQDIHKNKFINFDDNIYVTENQHVKEGISFKNIIWAFNINDRNDKVYWHPLTWLSHMLDYEFFGLNAGLHHLISLCFHITNVLLLFLALRLMTGMIWQSAFVAAVFAVHPINVDSVAWIAERKNVLSSMFWLLCMVSYFYYTKKPCLYRYLFVIMTMAAGLMAKPMLVTLPFVFLLLDFWPLNRIHLSDFKTSLLNFHQFQIRKNIIIKLLVEKIPLLLLSFLTFIFSSMSLYKSQQIISTDTIPLSLRISNIPVSYVKYMIKMVWPQNLAIHYPFPAGIPISHIISSSMVLIFVTIAVTMLIKKAPYLFIGWFWFVGTLFPVSGLIQGGRWPEMAERWMYVPGIGLLIMISWGVGALLSKIPKSRFIIVLLAMVVLTALIISTRNQTAHWQNSISLFTHTLTVSPNNAVAHNNIGTELNKAGRAEEAIVHFNQALRINPVHDSANYNMGLALDKLGRTDEAINYYQQAIRIKPDYVDALYNLSVDLEKKDHMKEAIRYYEQLLQIDPYFEKAHNNLGNVLDKLGRTDEAIKHYLQAIRINPDFDHAYYNLGNALQKTGRPDEAISYFSKALRINPNLEMVHNNLAGLYFDQNQMDKAVYHYQKAVGITPQNAQLHFNLAVAFYKRGKAANARQHLQTAIKLNPDYDQAKNLLKRLP